MKPLCIDLFCGLGGWAQGFLAEGYEVIGFDIERHDYGTGGYPGQLVLQDVLTLDGRQFRGARVIVASPPCQAYSYRAMPWKRAKALPPPSNELFDACFRIAREAGVPIVVENVKGAQPWVGRAKWHYGSYYLWGDVPALMPSAKVVKVAIQSWSNYGKPGYVAQGFNVEAVKVASQSGRRTDVGNGVRFTSRDCGIEGTKNGNDWLGSGEDCSLQRRASSGSNARKAASAQIAKIPLPLAQWIARVYHPQNA